MTVSRWERGVSTPRRAAREVIAGLVANSPPLASTPRSERPITQPRDPFSAHTAVDELVRIVGLEPALRALRRLALGERPPRPVAFPVDPARRLREVEAALREQSELIARARVGGSMGGHAGAGSSRLIDALKQAHEVLSSVGVDHALLGRIAANLYRREARATQDVDFGVKATVAERWTLAADEAERLKEDR